MRSQSSIRSIHPAGEPGYASYQLIRNVLAAYATDAASA